MSQLVQDKIASGEARIVEAPVNAPVQDVEVDRSFGLPTALFATTVACYLGFLAIMAGAFGNPGLIIPMAIFAFFIVAGFGVPTIFTRLKGNDSKPLTQGQFEHEGIMTHTGRLAPRDATIQVLILPVLLVCWGIAAVTIAVIVA